MATTSPVSNCLDAVKNVHQTLKNNPTEMEIQYWVLIDNMVSHVMHMEESERLSLIETISRDESGLLFGAARSGSVDAVLRSDPFKLQLGLLALIIENLNEDYRESLMELCLLDHSAHKLGVVLDDMFDDVRAYASEKVESLFDTYLREGERNIEAMGFVEDVDRHGDFTYTRTW